MNINICFRTLFIILFIQMTAVIPGCTITTGGKPQEVEDIFVKNVQGVKVEIWVENLDVPWSLVFLNSRKALVSERTGQIRLIKNGSLQIEPFALIDTVKKGEAGLMGLAVHPEYPDRPYIYAMHSYEKNGSIFNRVIRLKEDSGKGRFDRVIIDAIPGGAFHDGGRIAFGPDGMLYITTGETFSPELARDLHSLAGKILRVTPDGGIPPDNPFGRSPVYSYGHRNPQGLAWQPETASLFESEHGPSGEFGKFAHDEINLIIKGGNYGWPDAVGATGLKDKADPLIVWKKTTPPSGMTFYRGNVLPHLQGDLFVATLRSQALVRIRFADDKKNPAAIERWFAEDYENGIYGRLRDVVEGPDGMLYFLSNNTDGRGVPKKGDDRIYRITPE